MVEALSYPQQTAAYPPQDQGYGYQPQPPRQITDYTPISGANPDFLRWILNFRKQVVDPLKHVWRGEEIDDLGRWIAPVNKTPIMNERGITWAISLIDSFINPVFVLSNYDDYAYCARMRILCKYVINTICLRWEEFGLHKSDIPRVVDEIESKVQAILLGARGDGYREFFTKTHHTEEIKNQNYPEQERRGGIFNLGIFGKNRNQ